MIIQKIIGSAFLGICSVTDIFSRKIYLNVCLGFIASGIFVNGLMHQNAIWKFAVSMLPGVLVMFIALVSRGNIGMGDGIIITTMGVIYGLRNVLHICSISFLVLSLYCLVMVLTGKRKLKDKIPLCPFFMVGNLGLIICGGM